MKTMLKYVCMYVKIYDVVIFVFFNQLYLKYLTESFSDWRGNINELAWILNMWLYATFVYPTESEL